MPRFPKHLLRQFRPLPSSLGLPDAELHFEDKVDYNFPMHNLPVCYRLIHEALEISPSALYALMYELCSGRIDKKNIRRQAKMIRYIQARMHHPAKDMVAATALMMLAGKPHSMDNVIDKVRQLNPYPDSFYALQVISNSYQGSDLDDDEWERLEVEYETIKKQWIKNTDK